MKIHKWIWAMCMSWGRFLKEWQVADEIIEWIFLQFSFNHFINDSNSRNNDSLDFENSHMDVAGLCMSGAMVLKQWQVTDKIIEWIFFQITFNFLWMTQTQEIITHRVLKIYTWIWGNVYELGKVS